MSSVNPAQKFGIVPKDVAGGTSGLAFLQGMLNQTYPAPPFTQTTDIWLAEAETGRVVFEAMPSARFYNPLGTVHGGWISDPAQLGDGMRCPFDAEAGQGFTTVDLA